MTFLKALIRPRYFFGFIFILSFSAPSWASEQNLEVSRAVSQCLVNQATIEQCNFLTQENILINKQQNRSPSQAVGCFSNFQALKEKQQRGDFAKKCTIQSLLNLSVPTTNPFQPTTLRAPARR